MNVELWAVLDGGELVAVDLRERIARATARGRERGYNLPTGTLKVVPMKGEIHGICEQEPERSQIRAGGLP